MTRRDETNYLADALSTRVARDFPESVWQRLFVERGEEARLQAGTWSVVCAETPWDGRMSQDEVRAALGRLATSHDGHLDAGPGATSLAAFSEPGTALRVALALQRRAADARLRIGVLTAHAGLARFQAEGAAVHLLVGEPLTRAPALLRGSDPGTVQLCGVTYDALAGYDPDLDACLVMADYDGDALSRVTLTLPPAHGAMPGTVAGFGPN